MLGTDTVNLEATVFCRMDVDEGTIETGVLDHAGGGAMLVFRSVEEADQYRADTGTYPEGEGWGAVSLKPEHMRGLLEMHPVARVAFPQKIEGGGCFVHFYEAHYFLTLLEAAPMFLDALEN